MKNENRYSRNSEFVVKEAFLSFVDNREKISDKKSLGVICHVHNSVDINFFRRLGDHKQRFRERDKVHFHATRYKSSLVLQQENTEKWASWRFRVDCETSYAYIFRRGVLDGAFNVRAAFLHAHGVQLYKQPL